MKSSKIGAIILLILIAIVVLYVLFEQKWLSFRQHRESMSTQLEPIVIPSYSDYPIIPINNSVVYDPRIKKVVNINTSKTEGAVGDAAVDGSGVAVDTQPDVFDAEITVAGTKTFMFGWKPMLFTHIVNNTSHVNSILIPNVSAATAYQNAYERVSLPSLNLNYEGHAADKTVVQQLFYKGRRVYQINQFVKFDPESGNLIMSDDSFITIFSRPATLHANDLVGEVHNCGDQAHPTNTGVSSIENGFFSHIVKNNNMDILFMGYQQKTLIAVFAKVAGGLQLLSSTRFDGMDLVNESGVVPNLNFTHPEIDLVCTLDSSYGNVFINGNVHSSGGRFVDDGGIGAELDRERVRVRELEEERERQIHAAMDAEKDKPGNAFSELESLNELVKNNPFAKYYLWSSITGGNTKVSEDYILKTQVVPPVCPSCPACTGNGVCNSCGGKGGAGSCLGGNANIYGSGTNGRYIRMHNGLLYDTVTGIANLGEEAIEGGVDLTKQAVGGAVDLTKQAVGGAVGLARETVGGAVGLAREAVGGVAHAVGDVASVFDPRNYLTISTGGVSGGGGGQYINNQGALGAQRVGANYPRTEGADPMSYYGALSARSGDFVPITADFSAFGR